MQRVRNIAPAALLALGVACVPGWSSTIRHDRTDEAYIDYGDGFHLVGGVRVGFESFGSGIVIAPDWVLTAAHVVADVTESTYVTFETDPDPNDTDEFPASGLFGVTQVAIHEYYDPALNVTGGFDIALLKLDHPVEHYTGEIRNRFRGNPALNPELGRKATAVGFGNVGDGVQGFIPDSAGFYRLAVDNTLDSLATDPRIINEFQPRTVVDPDTGQTIQFTREQIAAQFMIADFDAPPDTTGYANPLGSAIPWDLEGNVAPGDSGGPLLVQMGDGYEVIGVNAFIDAFDPPDGDSTDNASYGDISGFLRITPFNDWIDSVIGYTYIPEPGSAAVVFTLAGFLLPRRGRKAGGK